MLLLVYLALGNILCLEVRYLPFIHFWDSGSCQLLYSGDFNIFFSLLMPDWVSLFPTFHHFHNTGVPPKKKTFLTFYINLFSAKTYKHVISKESLENYATGHISFDNMV